MLNKRKKIYIILLITVLMFSMSACGSNDVSSSSSGLTDTENSTDDTSKKVYTLKAGHVLSAEHPYQLGFEKMAELLEARSDGRIKLEIYPSAQLGNERDLFEGCQMGTVDLAVGATAPLANFKSDFLIFDLPYLFESKKHAYKALDGDFGKEKLKLLEDVQMIGLGYWECGYFDLLNTQRPLNTPEDCEGLTIRVMENKIFMSTMEALGINPVPMAWSEVFTSIQNGTVDGTSNPIVTIADSKMYTIAKYFTIAEPIYSPSPIIMSKATYDSMPEDLQKIIREVAAEVVPYQRGKIQELEDKNLEMMQKEGLEVIKIKDKQPWIDAIKEKVYSQYVPDKISPDDIAAVEQYK